MHLWVDLIWKEGPVARGPRRTWSWASRSNLSVFTTQALIVDFDRDPDQIGALTAEILKMLLGQALEAQLQRDDAEGTESRGPAPSPFLLRYSLIYRRAGPVLSSGDGGSSASRSSD